LVLDRLFSQEELLSDLFIARTFCKSLEYLALAFLLSGTPQSAWSFGP
jgi:hypothetical protein